VPARARIDGDRLTLTFRKPSGEERDAALIPSIRLNAIAKPKQIDIHTGFEKTEYVKRGITRSRATRCCWRCKTARARTGGRIRRGTQERAIAPDPAPRQGRGGRGRSPPLRRGDPAAPGGVELIATEPGPATSTESDRPKVRLHFRGDRFNAATTGRDPDPAYSFHLDETREPEAARPRRHADGPQKGLKGRGIYSLTGDALMLCFTFDDSAPRPTDFTAGPESKRILHILRTRALVARLSTERQCGTAS